MVLNKAMEKMTFYQRFESDILSGKKTITIRDASEKHYIPGSMVQVFTYEDGRKFGQLKIQSVVTIQFNQLNNTHAKQENLSLAELKKVIQEIYPNIKQLYVLSFKVVKSSR